MRDYFTEEFLIDVIKRFGTDMSLMSTNCNAAPNRFGDYVFIYGSAQEVLDKLKKGVKTYFV